MNHRGGNGCFAMPYALLENKKFEGLTLEAKMLYTVLLDKIFEETGVLYYYSSEIKKEYDVAVTEEEVRFLVQNEMELTAFVEELQEVELVKKMVLVDGVYRARVVYFGAVLK
ncbi:MAG: hypothetical protein R3Y53_05105 [Bacillota bacterium]